MSDLRMLGPINPCSKSITNSRLLYFLSPETSRTVFVGIVEATFHLPLEDFCLHSPLPRSLSDAFSASELQMHVFFIRISSFQKSVTARPRKTNHHLFVQFTTFFPFPYLMKNAARRSKSAAFKINRNEWPQSLNHASTVQLYKSSSSTPSRQ